MASVALLPALSLIAGGAIGLRLPPDVHAYEWLLPIAVVLAAWGWYRRARWVVVALLVPGFVTAGAVLVSEARLHALQPTLRTALERAVGGFDIQTLGPERDHDPIPTRAVLLEDAAIRDGFVSLRARVVSIGVAGEWLEVEGGVSLSVSGEAASAAANDWRAGRTVETPVSYRRPSRYLNDGVVDFERDVALGGVTLFGSVKSALIVEIVERGSFLEESAAHARAHVRRVVARWVALHDPIAAAVVTAVLIGDRTGLPDAIRERLQAAGTYHVIAISGGNIAILAAVVLGVLTIAGVRGRSAALVAIVALITYSEIATAGPSVWRATLMAAIYFTARLFDHRAGPWQAASLAAAVMVAAHPLDIRDPGFILTFGATVALLEGARRGRAWLPRRRAAAWLVASVVASLATEVALLPVSAQSFSRITGAGLVLNLIAVPMMGVAQVAGMVVALVPMDAVQSVSGWLAYAGASTLIESSKLVDVAPWLTTRVPPPGASLVTFYYVWLGVTLAAARRWRPLGALGMVSAAIAIAIGWSPTAQAAHPPRGVLRWTVFDVGQGEAMLLQHGTGTLLVDAGGAPFGTSSFDIGARVLLPALWARGVKSLETVLVTHGDPDHLGGAASVVGALLPRETWEGIVVTTHTPMRELRATLASRGRNVAQRRAGEMFDWHGARIRVLHPPEPDWERPRVRNDDSVVLEIVYGDVALLLTGDVSAEVERELLPRLTAAPVRVLKVAHHGSRTSTSRELLKAWRPQYAVISAGRGNTFGHPAPEVVRRLDEIGARVFRTDLHGQVTLETDGRAVSVRTHVGRQITAPSLAATRVPSRPAMPLAASGRAPRRRAPPRRSAP